MTRSTQGGNPCPECYRRGGTQLRVEPVTPDVCSSGLHFALVFIGDAGYIVGFSSWFSLFMREEKHSGMVASCRFFLVAHLWRRSRNLL